MYLFDNYLLKATLLTVKQNNDLLCHSQLDGAQVRVAMIC